jgi:hypothetical protein
MSRGKMFRGLEYTLRSTQDSTPSHCTSIGEQGGGRRFNVTVFHSDPVVHKVSSLLAIQDAPNILKYQRMASALKLDGFFFDSEFPNIPVGQEVQIVPLLARGVPDIIEDLMGH